MIDRNSVPSRLAIKFSANYKTVMKHYSAPQQIELSKYLQGIFKLYLNEEESTKKSQQWMEEESERVKRKFGKDFKPFMFGGLFKFLHFETVLVEKGVYTSDEYNTMEEQGLSRNEISCFLQRILIFLQLSIDELYLESEPEEGIKNGKQEEEKAETNKKGKIKREAGDRRTLLSQEQTVLLIYYLQQEKVLLKDEYLSDKDAGEAFEILTGYSRHTLRQNLGKYYLVQNRENLKELDNLLTRMKIKIGNDLKNKKL